MKKFTKLFTACMAFVLSLGAAWAQEETPDYSLPIVMDPGASVLEIDPDQDVFLMAAGSSKYNVGLYFKLQDVDKVADASFTANAVLDMSAIFRFELVEGKKCEGFPVYRLKHKESGLYLKKVEDIPTADDLAENATSAEWSVAPKFTKNVEDAFEATVQLSMGDIAEDPTLNPRQAMAVGNAGQTYDPSAWIICDVNTYEYVSGGYLYLCHYGYISCYKDTDQWTVGEVLIESDPQRTLASSLTNEMPDGMAPYVAGTNPGEYDAEKVAALEAAYLEAQAVPANSSYEVCNAAYVKYREAKAACEKSLVMVKDGTYYFLIYNRAANGMYATTNNDIKHTANYAVPVDSTVSVNDARYMWKTVASTKEGEEGMFYLQNYYTGKYAAVRNVNYTAAPTTDEPEIAFEFQTGLGEGNSGIGRFKLVGTNGQRLHCDGSGNMVRWNEGDGAANYAKFIVADDLVATLAAQVAQNKVNEALQAVYDDAKAMYDKGFKYGFFADSVFHTNDGLVTSSAQLSTNAQEATEGPIADLLDGNFGTYFHSDWHNNYTDVFHYIQADLGEAVSGITLKYAKRVNDNNNDKPGEFRVSVTNDPNGDWIELGDKVLDYQYSNAAVNSANADLKATFAGSIEIDFSGAEYQYIRLECTRTTSMVASEAEATTGTMIQLSEMRFYKIGDNGVVETNELKAVPADVRTALETALAKAEAELEAGAATQATIEELQAAYDAFVKEFADPAVLRAAIEEARTVVNDESYPLPADKAEQALGEYSAALKAAIVTEVDKQQAILDAGTTLTKEIINSGVEALEAAVEAFLASCKLPEEGRYYVLKGVNEANATAFGATVYPWSTNPNSAITYLPQVDGADVADFSNFLNMLWKAEACAEGKITLRNIGTGFYMGTQNVGNRGIGLSKDVTSLEITGAKKAGAFNIMVGVENEGKDNEAKLYINIAGNKSLLTWYDGSADANNAVGFVDVTDQIDTDDVDVVNGASLWYAPTTSGAMILTLPYTIAADLEGGMYDVIGIFNDGENNTLELTEITDVVPAGTPFVYIPSGADAFTTLDGKAFISTSFAMEDGEYAESVADFVYATEEVPSAGGVLVGSLCGTPTKDADKGEEYTAEDIIPNGSIIFKNGKAKVVGANSEIAERLAVANSGYVLPVVAEEQGDESVELPADLTTGIGNYIIVGGAADVDVYTISGVKVRKNVKNGNATNGLPAGIYVVGGKKVLVK